MRNIFIPVLIITLLGSAQVFASGENHAAARSQAAEIKELKNRIDGLEQTVNALKAKIDEADVQSGAEIPVKVNNVSQRPVVGELLPENSNRGLPSAKPAETVKAEYDMALALLKNDKFAEAEKKFAEFAEKYPKHQLRENTLFWYAESFYRRNNFNQAALHYLKSYKAYPKGAKAADSLLKLALSLGNLRKTKEACGILQKLEAEFPDRAASSVKRATEAKKKFGCK